MNLDTVMRVDVGVDIDFFENPDICLVVFDEDFVHHI
jgi:hypothetical protein